MEPLFASSTLAAGYARSRPPVHPLVIERARLLLQLARPLGCAVDIGCGAGLSTRPLGALARTTIGVEPLEPMLAWTREVAPDSHFLVGRAEQLPLAGESVDLLAAAGSLNYARLDQFFPEARRVLRPAAHLIVYDFSQGRKIDGDPALEVWFDTFISKYPPPRSSGQPLDPAILSRLADGFQPVASEWFEEPIALDHAFYVDYAMTETNVAAAVRAGSEEAAIRQWCHTTLAPVFGGGRRRVVFTGYLACFSKL